MEYITLYDQKAGMYRAEGRVGKKLVQVFGKTLKSAGLNYQKAAAAAAKAQEKADKE